MMKNNSGITMISLVVTIVVLMIISSITVNIGLEAYNNVKIQNFITKMKVIQGKVDQIAEMSEDEKATYKSDEFLSQNTIADLKENGVEFKDAENGKYYSYNADKLEEKLGLKDINMNVAINFETREVISTIGIKVNDTIYYTQYNITGGEELHN